MSSPAQISADTQATGAEKDLDCIAALQEFARRGFMKTSIVGLAEAMGIARQTLYNRFDNKEAILEWAVNTLAARLRADALRKLSSAENVNHVLSEVFAVWLSPVVTLLNQGPYSEEILGLGRQFRTRANADPLHHMREEIRDFLLRRKVRLNKSDADDLTLLLIYAAKGLMVRSATEAEFSTKIKQLIRGAGI